MSAPSPAVDAYIAKAKPFARPILEHIRATIHRAVPEIEETIKWSMPFFVYRGIILGNMAAFKEHASFGLWGKELVADLQANGVASGGNMGSFGRLCSLDDLPVAELEAYVRRAAALIGEGKRTRSIQRVAKPARPAAEVPEVLVQAFKTNKAAARKFQAMSPSCQREYTEWIGSAKRDDTRAKRVATALEWIAEGRGRNWKYEAPA